MEQSRQRAPSVSNVLADFETGLLRSVGPDHLPWYSLISMVNNASASSDALAVASSGTPSIGYTALHFAAFFGKTNYASLLVSRGCPVDARSSAGATPLFVSATFPRSIDTARVLLLHGADIDATNPRGISPLIHAVEAENVLMVSFLLESGANPAIAAEEIVTSNSNATSSILRRTALFSALRQCNELIAVTLVQGGAPVREDASSVPLAELVSNSRSAAMQRCWLATLAASAFV